MFNACFSPLSHGLWPSDVCNYYCFDSDSNECFAFLELRWLSCTCCGTLASPEGESPLKHWGSGRGFEPAIRRFPFWHWLGRICGLWFGLALGVFVDDSQVGLFLLLAFPYIFFLHFFWCGAFWLVALLGNYWSWLVGGFFFFFSFLDVPYSIYSNFYVFCYRELALI